MIVMKFGGTSVQDAEAIGRVISIVRGRLSERPLVVVSALARVTRLLVSLAQEAEAGNKHKVDELIAQLRDRHDALARELLSGRPALLSQALEDLAYRIGRLESFVSGVCLIGELSPRSKARIIAAGEQLSSILVCAAFNANGISCCLADARKMVITDDNYMSARPDLKATRDNVRRIYAEASQGVDLVVTQGFIATSSAGSTSVLGFEGSDYSAALFAMALDAGRVEIWTDVDGIRTADPRKVDRTCRIDRVSYDEAAVMASMGARVLHPLTIEPARLKNIPIQVLNSRNPSCEGTLVVRAEDAPAGPKSIAVQEDILFITVKSPGLLGVTQMLGRVFAEFSCRKIPVVMATASDAEVYLTVPEGIDALPSALEALSSWATPTVYRDKAQISIIGRDMIAVEGLGDKVIGLSGKVHMVSLGTNLLSECFVIDRDRLACTLAGLHDFIFNQERI